MEAETIGRYIILEWKHRSEEEEGEPVKFISELDEQGYDIRTVDVYQDGRCDYADTQHQHGTFLSPEPHPEGEEAELDPNEAILYEISKEEFEDIWQRVTNQKIGEVFPDLAVFKTK